MAKAEDDIPDFSELDLSDEDSDLTEPVAEPDESEAELRQAEQQAGDLTSEASEEEELDQFSGEAAEEDELGEAPEPEESQEKEEEEEEEEKEEKKKGGLLQALAGANPYTVMLALALLALLIAAFCLFMELRSYEYDIKAKNRPVAVRTAVDARPEPGQANAVRAARAICGRRELPA